MRAGTDAVAVKWTEELDRRMMELLAMKLSTAEVARRLGGSITKNSIIGRVARLEKTLGHRIDRAGIDRDGNDKPWTRGLRSIARMRRSGGRKSGVAATPERRQVVVKPPAAVVVNDDAFDAVIIPAPEDEMPPANRPGAEWLGASGVRLKEALTREYTDRDGRPWLGRARTRAGVVTGMSYAGVGRCQFILNAGRPPLFCGSLVEGSGAWCPAHYEVVFTRRT